MRRPPRSPLFPSTPLFRPRARPRQDRNPAATPESVGLVAALLDSGDRKSTRLNSSHLAISYAVFCLIRGATRNQAEWFALNRQKYLQHCPLFNDLILILSAVPNARASSPSATDFHN